MRTHLKTFLLFCAYFVLVPFPIEVKHLESYIVFLSQSFKTVSSIKSYVITVRFHHYIQGYSFPNISSQQFSLLFRGITKVLSYTPKRALPLTPPLLFKIFQYTDISIHLNLTLWTSILITFYTFCRKSSIIPRTNSSFQPSKHLLRRDITVTPQGLRVHIKFTKTMQAGEQDVFIPITAYPGSPMCPRETYLLMCKTIPAPSDSPAFVYPTELGYRSIGYEQFVRGIRSGLERAGIRSEGYQGHSLRRGAATWAFAHGVPEHLIQQQGLWRSNVYRQYLELSLETKLSITAVFAPSIYSLK